MEITSHWPDIYSVASECDELFRKCLIQIAEPRVIRLFGYEAAAAFRQFTREYYDRFVAWSNSLDVFSTRDKCLDSRLARSKLKRADIIGLLDLIFLRLQSFLEMIKPRDDDNPNERITRSHTRRTENLATELVKIKVSIDSSMNELDEEESKILDTPAAYFVSRDDHYLAKKSTSSPEDISRLMVQFLYPTAPLSLQEHLARSILERYFNLLTRRREHQRRLAARRSLALDKEEEGKPQVHNNDSELLKPITQKDHVDESRVFARDDSETRIDAVFSESGPKASTIQANEFHLEFERQGVVALPAISKTSSVPMGDISYPEPPKPFTDDESSWAVCCWCFKTHSYDKFQDARWWRRHVDHDLRPYICLIDTCVTTFEVKTFNTLSLWIEHMEEHHSPEWTTEINHDLKWECNIDHEPPESFNDEASLEDHMMEHHQDIFTESEIMSLPCSSLVTIPRSEYVCTLCGFDSSQAPLVAGEPEDLQHSSQSKRKRQSKDATHTELNARAQEKRRKTPSQDEGEIRDYGSVGPNESDLELETSPGAESISPQMRRKRLLRHIATHLKTLSFMTMRLDAFYDDPREGDESTAPRVEHEYKSEGGEPRETDTELDTAPLKFSDRPASPAWSGADFADDSESNSDNKEGDDNAKPVLISLLEDIPDQSPVASWIRSVDLFVQKSISPNTLNDGEIKILLIDHWADVSQSASKVQQPGRSPVRQDMSCDYSENARGSLMAQMMHRMCPHAKFFVVKSGEIDQITMADGAVKSWEIDQVADGAERAAKAIEWAIKEDVQIILMTGSLIESKENAEGIKNLDKQIQLAAAANISLYCTAAGDHSVQNGRFRGYTRSC